MTGRTWSFGIGCAVVLSSSGAVYGATAPDVSKVTGAQVAEHLVTEVLHVNSAHGDASDKNDGDAGKPLLSISRAVELADQNNKRNIGTKILIYPGVYRENVHLQPLGSEGTDAPLVIEAKEKGMAIISGSDIWEDWERQGETRIYTHHWPHKWGLCLNPWGEHAPMQPIGLRREMVFVDGNKLTQKLSLEELVPGSFYVCEDEEVIYLRPTDEDDLESAKVEIATRDRTFLSQRRKNIVLRGLTFLHDNQPAAGPRPGFYGSSDILVEDCVFMWNNFNGFGFWDTHGITFRRSVANNNGGAGVTSWKISNVIWEDNETSHNNWRGEKGGFVSWAVAGAKILQVHDTIIRRHRSVGNKTRGFWFDIDNVNIVVEDAFWVDNLSDGLFIEATQGPIMIRGSVIAFNGANGILSTNSSNVFLDDNLIGGNSGAQLMMTGMESRGVENFATGEKLSVRVENWTLRNNTIFAFEGKSPLLSTSAWEHHLKTIVCEKNLWYRPEDRDSFKIADFNVGFSSWQDVTGQDLNSIFADPRLKNLRGMDFTPEQDSPLLRREEWPVRVLDDSDGLAHLQELRMQQIKDSHWNKPYPRTEGVDDTRWAMLDIAKLANRPIGGDKLHRHNEPGGLIPSLPHLSTGIRHMHGVKFNILDEDSNDGVAAIGLHSWRFKEYAGKEFPQKVSLPVDQKVEAVYFLHGCAWAHEHKVVGMYHFIYEDGTSDKLEVIPLGKISKDYDTMDRRAKKATIQDWYFNFPQFSADQARQVILVNPRNPLDNLSYIYTAQWVNPCPDKTVREIVLEPAEEGKQDTTIVVLAVSLLKIADNRP
ncbi:MAG: right-handed parallel beta-helix repeat-containing protein [Victivallales bacterium]|nr:right-handed parallel beta-helix repeat-containing protein [Victivallales bacterium]